MATFTSEVLLMFSATKRLGTIAIIAGVINALMGVFILTFIDGLKLTFAQVFSVCVYVVTVSIVLLLLGAALFGLGDDLNLMSDANANEITKLKKRVDTLENMQ